MRTLLFIGLMLGWSVLDSRAQESAGIPSEVLQDMEIKVGVWVASNSAYQSDDEPFDSYVLEWSWGIGRTSIVGKLFGMVDGEHSDPFWEFRQYWNPGTREVALFQIGADGTVGTGTVRKTFDGAVENVQVFVSPDGTSFSVGHRNTLRGQEERSSSFDIADNGSWTERRTYIWRKQEG